jgi:hypothetical protein
MPSASLCRFFGLRAGTDAGTGSFLECLCLRRKNGAELAVPPCVFSQQQIWFESERQVQRHLDQARASDCALNEARPG